MGSRWSWKIVASAVTMNQHECIPLPARDQRGGDDRLAECCRRGEDAVIVHGEIRKGSLLGWP